MAATRYTIHRAGPEHLPGVVACLAAAFERHRPDYTPDAFNDTVPDLEVMAGRLQHMTIFFTTGQGKAAIGTIACAVTSPGEGHLRRMAVLPEFQGLGIADGLLNAAEKELRAQGCSRVTLDTTRPLLRAMRFYTRHGYTRTDRLQSFFGMPLFEYEKQL